MTHRVWGTRRRLLAALCASAAAVALVVPLARPLGADGTPVSLRIEGAAATVFDATVTVSECAVTDRGGASHDLSGVALCALAAAAEHGGFTIGVQDFGFGLFVNRIAEDDTPKDFSQSWNFWVNDDPSSVGTDTYVVAPNDRILLTFAPYPGVPLRVTAPADATVDTDTRLVVEKRVGEFDASFAWQGRWEPAEGATLHLGSDVFPVPADGIVSQTFSTPGETVIFADGDGFVRSARTTLAVAAPSPSPSPSPSPTPSPSPSPSPTPSPTPTPTSTKEPSPTPTATPASLSPEMRARYATEALTYLRRNQASDGSIGGTLVSGWSVIAFGANGERAHDVRAGGRTLLDALAVTPLQSATDVERQILALRAAGVNPRSFAGQDLVAKLQTFVRDGQIGAPSLLNDDIFGVLAFLAAGEPANASATHHAVATLLERQEGDGAWESLDLTAAAVQALRAYARAGGSRDVDDALTRARLLLRGHQDRFGGFGENSATTSWGIQAIVALGEDPETWRTTDGATPWTALLRYRNASGGFGWQSNADIAPFMTAYAVPALLGVPWPVARVSVEAVPTAERAQPSPTPTATPQPSPRVAGAAATRSSAPPPPALPTAPQKATSPTQRSPAAPPGLSTEMPPSAPTVAAASLTTPPGFTPLAPVDRQFAVMLFAASNTGIGLALARIASRLRTFIAP